MANKKIVIFDTFLKHDPLCIGFLEELQGIGEDQIVCYTSVKQVKEILEGGNSESFNISPEVSEYVRRYYNGKQEA